ncbi:unnamed protein product [Caenorhabditis auriculariae]|uniref:Uncharacterized protein n=1 Tax=Caenorhabditis auriculariae TaxID=2777116 RepID=A0A8S1GRK3_9PELO|nr:unnamed protein product [Caenorhabditis auriculariae]
MFAQVTHLALRKPTDPAAASRTTRRWSETKMSQGQVPNKATTLGKNNGGQQTVISLCLIWLPKRKEQCGEGGAVPKKKEWKRGSSVAEDQYNTSGSRGVSALIRAGE